MAGIKAMMAILFTVFLWSVEDMHVQAAKAAKVKRSSMNCKDILDKGKNPKSGVYTVQPYSDIPSRKVKVYCDMDTEGGGWTVFQRRDKYEQQEDFFRTWMEYVLGFGNLDGEFWLGLDHIHALTDQKHMTLRIDMEDKSGNIFYAEYGFFYVHNQDSYFPLEIAGVSGNAGDGLTNHNKMIFSTKDKYANYTSSYCAVTYKGAWWYNGCHESNLNGLYGAEGNFGLRWDKKTLLKKTEMKMKPTTFE